MTPELLITVLVASLLGSLHCAAMCGGLVTAMGLFGSQTGARRGTALGFHVGRLLVYLGLGALAGAFGSAVDLAFSGVGMARVAAVVAGVMVLGAGVWGLMSTLAGSRFAGRPITLFVQGWLQNAWLVRRLQSPRLAGRWRPFLLGLASALLPCGWLYAFVISAAGAASAWGGAMIMLAFWFGTVPALLGAAVLVQRLTRPLKRHVPVLSAALLVLVGLSAIVVRINIPAQALARMNAAIPTSGARAVSNHLPCH